MMMREKQNGQHDDLPSCHQMSYDIRTQFGYVVHATTYPYRNGTLIKFRVIFSVSIVDLINFFSLHGRVINGQ